MSRELITPLPQYDQEYEIRCGQSVLDETSPSPFRLTRFNFVKSSTNFEAPATYKCNGTSKVVIEMQSTNTDQTLIYEGSLTSSNKRDYVLLFDGNTFYLERVGQMAMVSDTRVEAKRTTRSKATPVSKSTAAPTASTSSIARPATSSTTVQQPKPPSQPKEPPPSQTDSMNVDDEDEAFENELLQELLQNQRSQNSGESETKPAEVKPLALHPFDTEPVTMVDAESSSDSDSEDAESSDSSSSST